MRVFLLALACVLVGGAAHAQAKTCKNLSASLSFGPAPYDVYSASDATQVGTLSYNCGNKTNPVVSFSASVNGAYRPRQLQSGANALDYELYYDAAMTVVWGTGADSQAIADSNGKNASIPFYGRIFALQDVSVGNYSDTITVTFNF